MRMSLIERTEDSTQLYLIEPEQRAKGNTLTRIRKIYNSNKLILRDLTDKKILMLIALTSMILCAVIGTMAGILLRNSYSLYYVISSFKAGDFDLIITPTDKVDPVEVIKSRSRSLDSDTSFAKILEEKFINFTSFLKSVDLDNETFVKPRTISLLNFTSSSIANKNFEISAQKKINQKQEALLVSVDLEREMKDSNNQYLSNIELNNNEVLLTKELAISLGVKKGSFVYVKWEEEARRAAINEKLKMKGKKNQYQKIEFKMRVKYIIPNLNYFLPDENNNYYSVCLFNGKNFQQIYQLSSQANKKDNNKEIDNESLNYFEFSDKIIINHKKRKELYRKSSFKKLEIAFNKIARKISDKIGFGVVDLKMPIIEEMRTKKIINLILESVFYLISISLSFISCLIIFDTTSLVLAEKLSQLSIKRCLGMTKRDLFTSLFCSGIFLGIISFTASIFLIFLFKGIINYFFQNSFNIDFILGDFIKALLISLIIPQISLISPITLLNNDSIAENMSSNSSLTQLLKPKISNRSRDKINSSLILASLVSIVVGAALYYGVPLALLTQKASLLSVFYLFLFGCIICGMNLLLLNFSFGFETIIMKLFPQKKWVKLLAKKFGAAHRRRNKVLGLVMALSTTIVCFIQTIILIKFDQSTLWELRWFGSELNINYNLNLENYKKIYELGEIKKYEMGYCFPRLFNYANLYNRPNNEVTSLKTSELGGSIRKNNMNYLSLSPNYMKTTLTNFYKAKQLSKKIGGLNPFEYLSTRYGQSEAIVGSGFGLSYAVELKDERYSFLVNKRAPHRSAQKFKIGIAAILEKGPALELPRTENLNAHYRDIVLSNSAYFFLLEQENINFEELTLYKSFLKPKSSYFPAKSLTKDINFLRSVKRLKKHVLINGGEIFNWHTRKKSKDSLKNQIRYLFVIIALLIVALTSLSSLSSIVINLNQMKGEIEILRYLGVQENKVISIFLVENASVVIGGSFIGLFVASFCSWTITKTLSIIQEEVDVMVFPWKNALLLLGANLVLISIITKREVKKRTKLDSDKSI